MIWWYELIPVLLVVNIAVVAPFTHPDLAVTPPFVVHADFDPWIYDSRFYNGQFRPCSDQPSLECAVRFAAEP